MTPPSIVSNTQHRLIRQETNLFAALFHHIHKAIEREADRVLDDHKRQFFYLISWFLRAERARRKAATTSRQKQKQNSAEPENNSFTLIATALTQESFITLNRFMQDSYDTHEWQDLKAGMRCLTQIVSRIKSKMNGHTIDVVIASDSPRHVTITL